MEGSKSTGWWRCGPTNQAPSRTCKDTGHELVELSSDDSTFSYVVRQPMKTETNTTLVVMDVAKDDLIERVEFRGCPCALGLRWQFRR